MHKYILTFYSRYTEGDKVAFKWDDKIVHGTVSVVSCDIVDGHLTPIYTIENCDTEFSWGDDEITGISEKAIIED